MVHRILFTRHRPIPFRQAMRLPLRRRSAPAFEPDGFTDAAGLSRSIGADLARLQVLRRELRLVRRGLRRYWRRNCPDALVLRVVACRADRRGTERRDRALIAVR